MNSSKRQSLIIIGFGLIILSGIILYFSLSMPKVSLNTPTVSSTTKNQTAQVAEHKTEQITEYKTEQTTKSEPNSNFTQSSSTVTHSQSNDNTTESSVIYPLNLNTCTAEDLMTIKGIGEVKASNIIEYREYLGGYTSVEQIKNIKGIGDSTFEKISPYLTV